MITITSKKEGFRRCGVAHGQTPANYPDDRFTAEELEILQQEPMLVVQQTADQDGEKKTKEKPDKDKS